MTMTQQNLGVFSDILVEQYISNFEDLGYLVQDDLIDKNMVYDHFSYDVEKAWCNIDIRKIIIEARALDKSKNAKSDPIYGHFEDLNTKFIEKEGQSCADLAEQ
jgi:hypothetical protein